MTESSFPMELAPGVDRPALIDRLARRAVLAALAGLRVGRIHLDDGGRQLSFGPGVDGPTITLHVRSPRVYRMTLIGGTNGAAQAYIDGLWSCDDLTGLMVLMIRNSAQMNGLDGGLARVAGWADRLLHFARRNSRTGSRRNIAAHYDLGNDFFAEFLDPTMTYSSGIFESPDTSLHAAQIAKLDRVCRGLELTPDDHLLEIGTGWGGLAMHASQHYGCRVTTTTISRRQHELAVERIRRAGLTDRITVLLRDYRELAGEFDKLVSIEMIEAVGHRYYDTFFRVCGRCLRPGGRMLMQAITIQEQLYPTHLRSVDFIKRFVFPGSNIPAVSALARSAGQAGGLHLSAVDDLTPHYAETLRRWRQNVHARTGRIRALGYSEELLRLWDYYLCYCEGGFVERYIGLAHLVWQKP